jgi:gamma-glutamyltranspeptidase
MQVLWFSKSIKEAIDAPRFHHQLFPMHLQYEYGVLQVSALEVLYILLLMYKLHLYQSTATLITLILIH